MPSANGIALIQDCYRKHFCAEPVLGHAVYVTRSGTAALGFTRAAADPLFVEQYLDSPIETIASRIFDRQIPRSSIVEIGNLAASSATAMVALWGDAANDLGSGSEIAVATLTAPLRRMFARIGMPILTVARARADRLDQDAARWGSYYDLDPRVCLGEIAICQRAMAVWQSRRGGKGLA